MQFDNDFCGQHMALSIEGAKVRNLSSCVQRAARPTDSLALGHYHVPPLFAISRLDLWNAPNRQPSPAEKSERDRMIHSAFCNHNIILAQKGKEIHLKPTCSSAIFLLGYAREWLEEDNNVLAFTDTKGTGVVA